MTVVLRLAVLAAVLVLPSLGHFYTYLPAGKLVCFSEDTRSNERMFVHYRLPDGAPHDGTIQLDVLEPRTRVSVLRRNLPLHNAAADHEARRGGGGAAIIAGEVLDSPVDVDDTIFVDLTDGGRHDYCFTFVSGGSHARVAFEFTATPASAHAIVEATEDDVDAYLDYTHDIEGIVSSVREEVEDTLERQAAFDALVSSTHWRVIMFTGINLVTVLAVGAWQVVHLMRFFKAKKVV